MITTQCRSCHQLEGSHFCEQRPYMKWTLKFRVLIQRFIQMVITLSYLVHYTFNRHEIQKVCCTRYDKKLEYVRTHTICMVRIHSSVDISTRVDIIYNQTPYPMLFIIYACTLYATGLYKAGSLILLSMHTTMSLPCSTIP